jgi:hypothetical protein
MITARELGVDAETLWQAADKLRGSVDAAERKSTKLSKNLTRLPDPGTFI